MSDALVDKTLIGERAHNALRRGGLLRVADVVAASDYQLMALRNFGAKSLDIVRTHYPHNPA